MNKFRFLYYKLTHSILCFFRWHRLITWSKDIEDDDKQCWCCKEVGGGWIK